MTDEQIALARRAVACRGWRWLPGMLAGGFRICRVDPHGYRFGWSDNSYAYRITDDVLPDLTDPATLGCLLALVREAWRDQSKLWDGYIEVHRDHQSLFFAVQFQHDADGFLQEQHRGTGRSEAEALVAALEAAP